jgi:hypothetical protein
MEIGMSETFRTEAPRGGRSRRRRSTRGAALLVALLVVILAGAGIAGGAGTVAAQASTPTVAAGHPLVGTWIVDTEVDDPSNPPSFDAFNADGTVVNIGSDGASVGAWEATGPRTATFTFVAVTQGANGEAMVILRANLEVDQSGESFTASHSFTLVAPNGTILASAQGGTAHGTRLHSEPMEAGGKALPEMPTWTPATPAAGA